MLKEICFLLLSFCVIFTAKSYIMNIFFKSVYKKYDNLMFNKDYDNAVKLLESSKKFGVLRYLKDHLLHLYFATNQYEKFKRAKPLYGYIKPLNDSLKQKSDIEYKILDTIFLYLKDDIEQADEEYIDLIQKHEDFEYKIRYYGLYNLFSILKLVNSFYANYYEQVKDLYNYLIPSTINTSILTIITYYMCRVYEAENNTEAILKLIDDNKIGNNHYSHYLDKWRISK